ncbi:MAG: hypothetical protein ACOCVL_03470, partial [Candidatus Sumerlaeota bacterium]
MSEQETRKTTSNEMTIREEAPSSPQWWRRLFMFDPHIIRHLRELWKSRYLIFALTLRGIRARYKQSALGIGWALLTPIA